MAPRFLVFGAGAVGGVVGARLAQHGHDVVLIARGAHHDAIASSGLRIQCDNEDAIVPIPVVDHPSRLDVSPDDVVLFAMKSQDTLGAVNALAAVAPDATVVSLQNGVANERMLLRSFAHVYTICVMLPTAHLDPGVVQAYSSPVTGLLDIGPYPESAATNGAEPIAAALRASTFESIVRRDIMRWKYRKLLMNLGNAVQATCAPSDAANELHRLIQAEGTAALDAAGIAYASVEEDRERRGDRMGLRPIAGALRGGGSSWQSLARGTGAIESDWLNGEIVLLGREHGVATPANELIRRTANQLARKGIPPASLDATELLAQL